jgi:hypothetical protein
MCGCYTLAINGRLSPASKGHDNGYYRGDDQHRRNPDPLLPVQGRPTLRSWSSLPKWRALSELWPEGPASRDGEAPKASRSDLL